MILSSRYAAVRTCAHERGTLYTKLLRTRCDGAKERRIFLAEGFQVPLSCARVCVMGSKPQPRPYHSWLSSIVVNGEWASLPYNKSDLTKVASDELNLRKVLLRPSCRISHKSMWRVYLAFAIFSPTR